MAVAACTAILFSCKKLVDVKAPVTSTNAANVYANNATAAAVLTGIYINLNNTGLASGGSSLGLSSALSADDLELDPSNSNSVYSAYYQNNLGAATNGFEIWNEIYPFVFTCNSAIEGLNNSTGVTLPVKQQLLGEAKFMRAFFYFYLVNLYGAVPLAVSSDYKVNSVLPRSSTADVYSQIVSDLKDAENLLSPGYVASDAVSSYGDRVRPNKWAAAALLARVYLFTGDYSNAQAEATKVLGNSSTYTLSPLNQTFLAASLGNSEAIWQLQPINAERNTEDAFVYIPTTDATIHVSSYLLNAFEPNDQRRVNWIGSIALGGVTYFYPYKYKATTYSSGSATEYVMVLRLAEQYLIRAEAEAQQGNISGAQADLNMIRQRAGLNPTTASDKLGLLAAILHERQIELFTEWGHRWLDMKRTGNANIIMSVVCPNKGGTWSSNWQLYPVPSHEIQTGFNLTQNPGY